MQQFAIAGAASVRPFDPILSVQHSRQNIITGADFKQPRVKSLLERLVEFLNQKGAAVTGAEQRWSDEELYQLLKDVFPVPREENKHAPDDDRQNRD